MTTIDVRLGSDDEAEEHVTEGLVAYNREHSEMIRLRFLDENLRSRPVAAYAYADGRLVGGCTANTVDVWRWLTIDTMWVEESARRSGVGRELLAAVEREAQARGCRWSKLNTWDFQSPGFYERCGYVEYGREVDYPPGHVNVLMRKELG